MVTRLEDFLRRRSKVSLVVSESSIRESPGLDEACRILFGDLAQQRLEEYLAEAPPEPRESRVEAEG